MGWFSQSEPKPAAPRASSDGAFEAPNRTDRKQCWESRDLFFSCLDANNIVDSLKDKELAEKQCGMQGKEFEKNCAASWVHYFKKRRVVDYNREETVKRLQAESAQPLSQQSN